MNKEKIEYYAHLTITLFGVCAVGFILLRYLLVPVLPFLIAWAIAMVLRPRAKKIGARVHINERIVRVILTTIATLVLIALLIFCVFYLLSEVWLLINDFLSNENLPEILSKITNPLASIIGEGALGEDVEAYLTTTIREALSGVLSGIVNILGGVVKGIPSVLLFILVTVIASIYFAYDLERINAFIKRLLPKPIRRLVGGARAHFFSAGAKYVRSYLILMLLTYFVMLAGFLILKIEKAPLLALITAVLDILPVVGTGVILVPMSIYHLIFGNTGLGIGILVLFLLYQILRQIAEPRIVGKSLGVHPLLSLVLIYVGYGVFGLVGLFLMPVFSIFFTLFWNKNNTSEVVKGASAE